MTSLNFRQQGNFTVEFAIVGIVLSLLLVFSGDVIIKLSCKGKLDRLSYSMVNLLKERTQFYQDNYTPDQNNIDLIVRVAKDSMRRTMGQFDDNNFGYLIESVTFDAQQNPTYARFPADNAQLAGFACSLNKPLSQMTNLSRLTTWGRRATLYRVTLCYKTGNWFGSLTGVDFTRVQSDAVMIGR